MVEESVHIMTTEEGRRDREGEKQRDIWEAHTHTHTEHSISISL